MDAHSSTASLDTWQPQRSLSEPHSAGMRAPNAVRRVRFGSRPSRPSDTPQGLPKRTQNPDRARKSRESAGTRCGALCRVKPGPTLVAQQAAPVGLAVALPRLGAAPVDAAREEEALVAQRPSPPVVAPGGGGAEKVTLGSGRTREHSLQFGVCVCVCACVDWNIRLLSEHVLKDARMLASLNKR